ncbi:hypothetical protein BO82DRAFT_399772 [Aspergillus uvarum CBS 121591]|uniref:Uncharacterized protein n=1 Tax=Aspergillus uvarum CBS 121591 TaxID=1448315 RepID=A0A319DYZ6_9EURO|nr:hypothetical protein BO82DRAFT_399772 [Aspergillus uvarum CBS 121591]PYH84112.1 hypothetical protein BO82DRAFT_399772 [Aspergillus uvarum CBS 121591]
MDHHQYGYYTSIITILIIICFIADSIRFKRLVPQAEQSSEVVKGQGPPTRPVRFSVVNTRRPHAGLQDDQRSGLFGR